MNKPPQTTRDVASLMNPVESPDGVAYPRAARLLAIEEAARQLGVGRTTIFGLVATGDLRTVKIGRRRLVPIEAINELVERLSADAAEA